MAKIYNLIMVLLLILFVIGCTPIREKPQPVRVPVIPVASTTPPQETPQIIDEDLQNAQDSFEAIEKAVNMIE